MNTTPASRFRARRFTSTLAIAGVAALALSACSSSPGAETNSAGTPTSITIASQALPVALDPIVDAIYETTQVTFMWGGYLTNYGSGDASGTPQLAESLDLSEDQLTWTVTMKPDLKFSDGTPLTTADVAATFQRIMDTPGTAGDIFIGHLIGSLSAVTANDDSTVTFALSNPLPNFPAAVSAPQMVILPASGIAAGTDFWKKPISAGRYQLDSADLVNGRYEFSANANYYDDAPREVQKVTVVTVPDAATRLAQLKSGQVDYVDNIPGNLLSQVDGDLVLDPAQWPGGQMSLSPNHNDPIVGDINVRKAISLAVDREQIAQVALGGEEVGLPLYGIPWNQSNGAPNAEPFERDVDAAQALLAGTACENGCTIPVVTVTDSAWQVPLVAQVVQQQLAEIGITLELRNVSIGQASAEMADGNFGFFLRWIGYYDDGANYLGGYVYTDPDAGYYTSIFGYDGGFASDELSVMSDKIKFATADELPALQEQANELYAELVPEIPLTTLSYVGVSRYSADVIHNIGAVFMEMP